MHYNTTIDTKAFIKSDINYDISVQYLHMIHQSIITSYTNYNIILVQERVLTLLHDHYERDPPPSLV